MKLPNGHRPPVRRRLATTLATCLAATGLASAVLVLAAGSAAAQTPAGGLVTLPRHDASGALESFFYFRLADGGGFQVDRARRNALELRQRRLQQGLFQAIGRPATEPAVAGEILLTPLFSSDDSVRVALLVESSTGYAAYFEQLGKGGRPGEIRTTVGRPFARLAAAGGGFALLPRRAANGRTIEITLYRGATGEGLRLTAVDDLPQQPRVSPVTGLPTISGAVTTASLQGGGGRTLGYLLFDQTNGDVHEITLGDDGSIAARRERDENLFDVFPRDAGDDMAAGGLRFLAVPLQIRGQTTRNLLLIDAASGALALFADVDGVLARPSLRALESDLAARLPAPRSLAAVPRTGADGATLGVWVLDGAGDRMLYLGNLDRPRPTIDRVTLIR